VGSISLFLLTVGAIAIGFSGLMMLLAVPGRSEQTAYGIGWGVMILLGMVGGAIVPVFYMPRWLQPLSVISPVRWALVALEGAVWRSYSLSEMAPALLVLLGMGVVSYALAVFFFLRRGGRA
jgi:ABC-2 type transport system permease protein